METQPTYDELKAELAKANDLLRIVRQDRDDCRQRVNGLNKIIDEQRDEIVKLQPTITHNCWLNVRHYDEVMDSLRTQVILDASRMVEIIGDDITGELNWKRTTNDNRERYQRYLTALDLMLVSSSIWSKTTFKRVKNVYQCKTEFQKMNEVEIEQMFGAKRNE